MISLEYIREDKRAVLKRRGLGYASERIGSLRHDGSLWRFVDGAGTVSKHFANLEEACEWLEANK